MNSYKILVITHRPLYPPLYGYSKLVLDTYIALSKLGVSIYILSITPRNKYLFKLNSVIYREIPEHRLVFTKLLSTRLLLRISRGELLFLHLMNLYRNYSMETMISHIDSIVSNDIGKPDIVISETIYPSRLAHLLSRKYSVPCIIRTHNVESDYISNLSRIFSKLAGRYISSIEREALSNANRVISISYSDATYIKEHYGLINADYIPPIIIVEKPVDSEKYLVKYGLTKNKYFIYTASPHKPNIVFLKHIIKCSNTLEKYGYVLVISGSISSTASKYIEKIRARNTVVTGVISSEELYSLITNAYAVLAPHHGSGTPIKLVEPLILCIPVITTRNSLKSIRELEHCRNIYAVNSIDEFCSAIEELIVNKELYFKILEGVKNISNTLNYLYNAEKFLEIIRSTVHK